MEQQPTSERIATASMMSFAGQHQRIVALFGGREWLGWVTMLIPLAWVMVASYYMIAWLWLPFTWPIRLMGRGRRRRKREAAQHREMLAAVQRNRQAS